MATTTALLFGSLAGIGWGLGPIASKRAFQGGKSPVVAACVQASIGMVGLWALVAALFGEDIYSQMTYASTIPFIASGIIGSALARYLLYAGINRVGASMNSSIAATDPLFAVLIAAAFLNEIPTVVQLAGGVVVLTGVVLVGSSNGGDKSDWRYRALLIPAIAAVLYGVSAVIRRFVFIETAVSPVYASAVNETTALVTLSTGLVISRLRHQEPPDIDFTSCKYLILTGLLHAGGSISLFIALDAGPVVIGSTLGSTAAVISVLGSAFWLDDELVTKKVIFGTILTVFGILAISL